MSAELPEELPAGFEFGPYVIQGCIGRGGMARVYRAEQAALHRAVAIKVLDRWALEEATGRERFLREARAAASIKHPNVVDILDVGVWQERPYIVMELLVGHDLDSYLDQYGVLSESEIARLALPVLAGVMAVHDASVVHRDLKPSNIFLADGPEGETIPKVLDFGVSKVQSSLNDPLRRATNTREIVGTPAYMAPEALKGARELGPAADQYALGAVLYECAVGRPPFEGETLLELLMAVAAGKIEPPSTLRPDISPVLERIILRAISTDPRARFETLRDMGRALWPLADGRTQAIWERSFGNGHMAPWRSDAPPTLVGAPNDLPILERAGRAWRLSLRRPWLVPAALLGTLAVAAAVGAIVSEIGAPATPTVAIASHGDTPALVPGPSTTAPAATNESPPTELAPAGEQAVTTPEASRPRRPSPARAARRTAPRARAERRQLTQISAALEPAQSQARLAPRPPAEPAGGDPELEGLFKEPREPELAPAEQVDAELDGLFANTRSAPRGANGAPFPE